MVKAIILSSPDPQIWDLLGLSVPEELTSVPAPNESDPTDSGEVEDFLL